MEIHATETDMTTAQCPVCNSRNHQSFWFWEKEDKLMREWAMDTTVHFSICRDCALIFQNPPVAKASESDLFFTSWNIGADSTPQGDEPFDWLKQFTTIGKQPGRVLEVYSKNKRFDSVMTQNGWQVKTIRADRLMAKPETSPPPLPGLEPTAPEEDSLAEGEIFDLVLCFDVLGQCADPVGLLTKLHGYLRENGAIFVEMENPMAAPRAKKFCLTSDELQVFPFHTLIFTLYKAGFANTAAETCGRIRCLGTKADLNPDADPGKLMPQGIWGQVLYWFHRNYYWAWVISYLENFQARLQIQADYMDHARNELRQRFHELQIIRDVCGSCLLFVEEVSTLRNSLGEDWHLTLHRIFEIFKQDYALYDLLRQGPLEGVGTFPDVERFHFNEKMIYVTNADYFQRYFSEEETRRLCDAIIRAGQVVCRHLSSFL